MAWSWSRSSLLSSVGGGRLRGRVLPCHPRQQRALHPSRVASDPGERDGVVEDVLVGLALATRLHQLQELLVHGEGIAERLADDEVGHHTRGCLADRAALAVVGDI